jgi:hypothetical protein
MRFGSALLFGVIAFYLGASATGFASPDCNIKPPPAFLKDITNQPREANEFQFAHLCEAARSSASYMNWILTEKKVALLTPVFSDFLVNGSLKKFTLGRVSGIDSRSGIENHTFSYFDSYVDGNLKLDGESISVRMVVSISFSTKDQVLDDQTEFYRIKLDPLGEETGNFLRATLIPQASVSVDVLFYKIIEGVPITGWPVLLNNIESKRKTSDSENCLEEQESYTTRTLSLEKLKYQKTKRL